MDLRHLRHFLAVAETLNFTKAADRLFMASSPLSRSIKELEHEVGGPLFVRGTRKVELTPLGEALIPHARRVIADVEALARDMDRRVREATQIHLGMRSLPRQLIRAVVDDVMAKVDPSAVVHLEPMDSEAQIERLLDGRLTFGLVNRPSGGRRVGYLGVLTETPAMALPDRPEYADLAEVRPADVAGLRLLLQPGATPLDGPIADYAEAAREVVTLTSEIIGGIATMIASGDSCCLTLANPSAPWHRYLAEEGVVIRPLAIPVQGPTTFLAWRADRDTEADLGPYLRAARTRFEREIIL